MYQENLKIHGTKIDRPEVKIKKSTIIVGNQCNLSYQEGKE